MKSEREINRLILPDLLKGIAVIFMVQVHLTELLIEGSFIETQVGKLILFLGGVPAAPLFMVVMGFFATFKLRGIKSYLTRGVKLITWGFLLNIGLNGTLLYQIFFREWDVNPFPYLFGADILALAGISLIVIGIVLQVFRGNPFVFVLLTFIIPLLSIFLPYYQGDVFFYRYLMGFFHSNEWWSYFPVVPWLSYPLAGAAAGIWYRINFMNIDKIKVTFLIVGLITMIILWNYGYNTSTVLFNYYHHGIKFFIWAIGFLIVMIFALNFIVKDISDKNPGKKYLLFVGRNVTAFYVVQWLIIGNVASLIYKNQSPVMLPVWLITIVLISSIVVSLWNSLKVKFDIPIPFQIKI